MKKRRTSTPTQTSIRDGEAEVVDFPIEAGGKPWNFEVAREPDARAAKESPRGLIDLDVVREIIHSSILAIIAAALGITLLILLQQQTVNPPLEESILALALGWVLSLLWQRSRTR